MKLTAKSLKQLILEIMQESESDIEFNNLMDLAKDQGEGVGIQALDMIFAFDLTEKQIRTLYNVVLHNALKYNIEDLPKVLEMRPPEYSDKEMKVHFDMAVEAIMTNPDNTNPERLLKEIGYDFHKEFTQVYGVTPPRDKEFVVDPEGIPWNVNGEDVYISILTADGGIIAFSFNFEGYSKTNPSDPYMYFKRKDGDELWIEVDVRDGEIVADQLVGDDTIETKITKNEVPDTIRKFMGYATTEPVKEWPGLPLGSAAPDRKKLNREYLYKMINEVLDEEGGNEAEEFVQSLIDSKDISNLIYGLSIVEDLDDGDELTYGQARLFKVMMFNSIIENDLAISDISGAVEFISSKEFSNSFTEPALQNFRKKLFQPLMDTKLRDLIQYVVGNQGLEIYDESWGEKVIYSVRDVPNQEFIDEVVQKFSQITGNPRFAVGAYDGDDFHIFVGKYAMDYVTFNKNVKSVFGFETVGNFPVITKWSDGDVQFFETEGMGRVEFKETASPMHNGEEVDFKISYQFDTSDGWKLFIQFEEPFDDVKVRYHQDKDGYTVLVRDVKKMDMGSKEEMLKLVQDTTGIDLTNVERI